MADVGDISSFNSTLAQSCRVVYSMHTESAECATDRHITPQCVDLNVVSYPMPTTLTADGSVYVLCARSTLLICSSLITPWIRDREEFNQLFFVVQTERFSPKFCAPSEAYKYFILHTHTYLHTLKKKKKAASFFTQKRHTRFIKQLNKFFQ